MQWIKNMLRTMWGQVGWLLAPAPRISNHDVARSHADGRPLSPHTMRVRLSSHVERMAWIAEQRAEAAERERQEAERIRRRIRELDDVQLQREFQRFARGRS